MVESVEKSSAPQGTGASVQCVNCGHDRASTYCPACGQKVQVGRHTVFGLVRTALVVFTSLEGGLLHTMRELTTHPGTVIRGYIAGRTVPYSHPAAYFTIALGMYAVVAKALHKSIGAGSLDQFFAILAIPAVAGTARLFFWRRRWNYAEHLIAVVFLSGHLLLLMTAFSAGTPAGGSGVYGLLCIAVGVAYFVWAYSTAFVERQWAAAGSAVLALASGVFLWMLAVFGIVTWIRR